MPLLVTTSSPKPPAKRWPEVNTTASYISVEQLEATFIDGQMDNNFAVQLGKCLSYVQTLIERFTEQRSKELEAEVQEMQRKIQAQIREQVSVNEKAKQAEKENIQIKMELNRIKSGSL